jgi:hypothetical protein
MILMATTKIDAQERESSITAVTTTFWKIPESCNDTPTCRFTAEVERSSRVLMYYGLDVEEGSPNRFGIRCYMFYFVSPMQVLLGAISRTSE